jgi:hypothetical protein
MIFRRQEQKRYNYSISLRVYTCLFSRMFVNSFLAAALVNILKPHWNA